MFHILKHISYTIEYFYSDSINHRTIRSLFHVSLITPWTLFQLFLPLFPCRDIRFSSRRQLEYELQQILCRRPMSAEYE
jgi:hypothetical protein